MDNCYVPNNPNYPDLWRSSPLVKQDNTRGTVDFGVNAYSVSPSEIDPLSNIFSFSSPGYKDFAVFKEKKPADIADALLSLKHAVVHPGQMNGQLPSLSPGLPPAPQGSLASGMGHAPAFSYSVNPHGQHMTDYGSMGYGQYTSNPGQYTDISATQNTPSSNPMFPSMSVNVSMSMNVGVPNNGYGNGSSVPNDHAQWGAHSQPASHSPHAPRHYAPNHEIHMQAQYPAYGSAQAYNASYSFGSEMRSPSGFSNKEMMFRSTTESYKSMPKFYAFNNFGLRRKPPNGRVGGNESCKVNLCRICGKTYARPSTLKTHMRTHSGEKPYRCQTCNKSFSQAANLTAHVRTHSGEKPFRCHVCDRQFSQSSSVTTHMRTHSGERPYRCRMCKKAFSDSSTLTKHLRIHSGEKPYQCKLCLLRFSQSGNLNRHMRVHATNN